MNPFVQIQKPYLTDTGAARDKFTYAIRVIVRRSKLPLKQPATIAALFRGANDRRPIADHELSH